MSKQKQTIKTAEEREAERPERERRPYVAQLPTGDWTVMQWDPRVECYREGATCRTRAEAREYLRSVKGQE